MEAIPIIVGMLPLAALALVAWALIRGFGRGRPDTTVDVAASVRRFFLYGLLYVTLLVAAQGLVELASELLADADDRSTSGLARSLAFLVVGGPACAGLVRYVDQRLRRQPTEARSPAWTIYLNAALLTTLLGTMIEGHAVLLAMMASEPDGRVEADSIVAVVIWGALLAGHWFVLLQRHGVDGDYHLAIGTLVGLVPMVIGLAGVLHVGADEIYTAVSNDPLTRRGGPSFGAWAATAIVGGGAWAWYWLTHYRKARRSLLWYIVVVPIGSLAGFVATVAMVAAMAYIVAVWFLGDPGAVEAVRHFDPLPALGGVLAVGVLSLLYHRSLLGAERTRNDATRSADYVLSMAALVSAVIGTTLLLTTVIDIGRWAVANTVIAGSIMVAVGVPLWLRFWGTIGRHLAADRRAELRSPLRRIYLFSLFGIGGLTALISVLVVLTGGFEDLLEGNVSRTTLHDNRVGLALILSVTGVAWYHFGIYRAERADYESSSPAAATSDPPTTPLAPSVQPPPPSPIGGEPQRIIVVSADGQDLSRDLAAATGASVVRWRRTDGEQTPAVDLPRLSELIAESPSDDVLVLVGESGPRVIPFVADQPAVVGEPLPTSGEIVT